MRTNPWTRKRNDRQITRVGTEIDAAIRGSYSMEPGVQFASRTKPPGSRFVKEARKARRALLPAVSALAVMGALIGSGEVPRHSAPDAPSASLFLQCGSLVGELLPRGCWTGDLPVQRPYPIPRVPPPSQSAQGSVEAVSGL